MTGNLKTWIRVQINFIIKHIAKYGKNICWQFLSYSTKNKTTSFAGMRGKSVDLQTFQ